MSKGFKNVRGYESYKYKITNISHNHKNSRKITKKLQKFCNFLWIFVIFCNFVWIFVILWNVCNFVFVRFVPRIKMWKSVIFYINFVYFPFSSFTPPISKMRGKFKILTAISNIRNNPAIQSNKPLRFIAIFSTAAITQHST